MLVLGPKRDKTVGGWRKMHNKELHILYSPPNIIKMIQLLLKLLCPV
jgi:hypothetical protein